MAIKRPGRKATRRQPCAAPEASSADPALDEAQSAQGQSPQRLLHAILRDVTDAIVIVDQSGRVILESASAAPLLGQSMAGMALADWIASTSLFAADGRTRLDAERFPLVLAARGETVRDFELVVERPGRDPAVLAMVASPLNDELGSVVGAIASIRDVSERKRAAALLQRLGTLVETAPAAVLMLDLDGTVVDWNAGAARMFGYAAQEIVGRNVTMLYADRVDFDHTRERVVHGNGPQIYERLHTSKSGATVHVTWTAALVRDSAGHPIGISKFGMDVSDRIRIEHRLATLADEQRQQLGHDLHDSLGQQLTAIGMMATGLSDKLPAPSAEKDIALKLESGIEIAKNQLRTILLGLAPIHLDSGGLVAALADLAEQTRRAHGLECRCEYDPGLQVDDAFTAIQLYMVAREAVHNAIKHARARRIVIGLSAREGLRLSVSDDGIGLAHESDFWNGMGIGSMRHRCKLAGGEFRLLPAEGGGTSISCTISSSSWRSAAADRTDP